MNIGTLIYTYFNCKQVGLDQFGNRYFINKSKNKYGIFVRSVIYKGKMEASKVPPLWNAWLRYNIDEIPISQNTYFWQKKYKPNLTGTNLAYHPSNRQRKKKHVYQSWQPQIKQH